MRKVGRISDVDFTVRKHCNFERYFGKDFHYFEIDAIKIFSESDPSLPYLFQADTLNIEAISRKELKFIKYRPTWGSNPRPLD